MMHYLVELKYFDPFACVHLSFGVKNDLMYRSTTQRFVFRIKLQCFSFQEAGMPQRLLLIHNSFEQNTNLLILTNTSPVER